MRFLLAICVVGLFVGCGPEKKPAKTEEPGFDYRSALHKYKVGINYLNRQEVILGIGELEAAVELDPNNYRYRHGLGLGYSMNGQLEEAEAQLKEAIRINGSDSESYNLLGSIYIESERYAEAIEALKIVIRDKSYPQPQFPFFNLGLCMQEQGRDEEAIAAYTRVIQLDDDFFRAFVALGELYKKKGDYEKTLFYYKRAETGFANRAEVLYEIGHALFRLHRFEEAKSYLAQVSILFPPPNIDKPTQDMLRYIENYQRKSMN